MTDVAWKAQKILMQLWNLSGIIEERQDEILQLQDLAFRVSSVAGSGGGGHVAGSKIENAVVRMADAQRKLGGEIDKYLDMQSRITDTIDQMEDIREQRILRMRYVANPKRQWEEITQRLYLSKAQSYRLHESALTHFWAIWTEKYETK